MGVENSLSLYQRFVGEQQIKLSYMTCTSRFINIYNQDISLDRIVGKHGETIFPKCQTLEHVKYDKVVNFKPSLFR